jgi:hypothetical protein
MAFQQLETATTAAWEQKSSLEAKNRVKWAKGLEQLRPSSPKSAPLRSPACEDVQKNTKTKPRQATQGW